MVEIIDVETHVFQSYPDHLYEPEVHYIKTEPNTMSALGENQSSCNGLAELGFRSGVPSEASVRGPTHETWAKLGTVVDRPNGSIFGSSKEPPKKKRLTNKEKERQLGLQKASSAIDLAGSNDSTTGTSVQALGEEASSPAFEEDEDDSPEFQAAAKIYEEKKANGSLNRDDATLYSQAKRKEAERKESIKRRQEAEREEDDEDLNSELEDENESCQAQQGELPSNHDLLFLNDEEGQGTEGFLSGTAGETRCKTTKKGRRVVKDKNMSRGAAIGYESAMASKKSNKKRALDISDPSTLTPSSRTAPEFAGLSGTLAHDLFRTAGGSHNRASGGLPTERPSEMDHVLRRLLETVPSDHDRFGNRDQAALDAAVRMLDDQAHARQSRDGWLLGGMQYPLKPFQLLGVGLMRTMERREDTVRGGILADQMGLGKTVSTIANIVDGKHKLLGHAQTTLIIVPSPLVQQWNEEIKKHSKLTVMTYAGIIRSNMDVYSAFRNHDVVITSYYEVRNSFPKFEPPPGLMEEEWPDWWHEHYAQSRGELHRVEWLRIVCDECTAIKNYKTWTAAAVSALVARHRWLLSGTIIMNDPSEFYSYFRFLREPMAGTFDCFSQNFINSSESMERLYQYLYKVMIRRTHDSQVQGHRILKLPPTRQETVELTFSTVERLIYNIVLNRACCSIVYRLRNGLTRKVSFHVLVRLLLLRQISAHFYCGADLLVRLLYKADLDKIKAVFNSAEAKQDESTKDLLKLKDFFSGINDGVNSRPGSDGNGDEDGDAAFSSFHGLLGVNPASYLRLVRQEDESQQPAHDCICTCARCEDDPEDCQLLTPCGHHICRQCLQQLRVEAALGHLDKTRCAESDCGVEITGQVECSQALTLDAGQGRMNHERKASRRRLLNFMRDPDNFYASTKTLAVKAAIMSFKKRDPSVKVIVFTSFLHMISILGQLCAMENWGFQELSGDLTRKQKDHVVKSFHDNPNLNILISSVQTGGVGLNLTCATKVVLVDLWWNSSVDQQAFSRVYRMGQTKETSLHRLAVKDSMDTKLLQMQIRKDTKLKMVLEGQPGKKAQLSLEEMLRLFDAELQHATKKGAFVLPRAALDMVTL